MALNASPTPRSLARKVSLLIADVDGTLVTKEKILTERAQNDMLMFAKSGVSIAMGNAGPEVQQSAHYVTTSYEEEGFANAVERFILSEKE